MASENVEAPATYKQPSRKGKKAWRKNVDVTEVTEGLDNVRDELIKGGVIAEKTSDELFLLDTTGSTSIQATYNRVHKPLKADQILAERSAIPAIDSRKRALPKNTTSGVLPAKRQKTGVSHKDYDRLRSIAYGGDAVKKDVVEVKGAAYDPWSTEEIADPRFSFLPKQKPTKEPDTLKHAPISLLASGKAISAVRKPHAGKSYNPTFEDWDRLVTGAGEREVEAERRRLDVERAEQEQQARVDAHMAEESDGGQTDGGESAWESEWEGIQSEAEEAERLKQKRPERKTQVERNKIKRRKEAERQALAEKKRLEKERQLQRTKALVKAAEEKAKTQELVLASANDSSDFTTEDEDGDEQVLRRKRFGKITVPEAPLEVVLADELQESLRLLKPEGNLLKDRFRSMQVRGKIETRKQISMPKQPKRFAKEKWSYKDWKLK